MGTDIGDLLLKDTIEIAGLSNKVIAIDAYNTLYQFLSIIRQRDGTPLKDSNGQVTSHLSGILYRLTNLVESGVKPVLVFDGKPPMFKSDTLEKRHEIRETATEKWEDAKEHGDEEEAYKYAQASSKVTREMVADSAKLLELMGIPYVNAPSEGEAQAAYMVQKGDADYIGSQDYDSLLFGAPQVVRNLTITGKRKLPKKNIYVDVKPEILSLKESLDELGVTRDQLIDIAMCIGTDYDPGIENIGPKRALKLIKEHGSIKAVLAKLGKDIEYLDAKRDLFINPSVTDDYELSWGKPDRAGVIEFLCKKHDFSEERVNKALDRLEANMGGSQSTLDQWF